MLYIKFFIEREKNIGQSAPECPFNESTTFWERSGRHPDPNPDISGNPDWNPGSLSVEILALAEVCTF